MSNANAPGPRSGFLPRRGIVGDLRAAWRQTPGPSGRESLARKSRAALATSGGVRGARYEALALAATGAALSPFGEWLLQPWIAYADESAPRRFAQPDGVLLGDDLALIVECKLSARSAWWGQIADYERLLAVLEPARVVRSVMLARNLTPGGDLGAPVVLGRAGLLGLLTEGAPPRAVCHWTL